MNYLQDDEGQTIPIPDAVYLSKGVVSFIDFAIRGEKSTDFQVPNDSQTRAILGFYSINQSPRLVSKRFSFYVDGNKVSDGRVYVRSVGVSIDMFFIGGNSNWMNAVTGSIKDIDLSRFDCTFDAPTIVSKFSATEGIIFPLVDWAYNFKKLGNTFLARSISGVRVDSFYDFYPCVYTHTILDQIFAEYGIKVAGNLWDDPIFLRHAITAEFIQSAAYASFVNVNSQEQMSVTRSPGNQQSIGTTATKVQMDSGTETFDDTNDRLTFTFTAASAVATITIHTENNQDDGTLYLYKNGASVFSQAVGDNPKQAIFTIGNIASGDYFELFWQSGSGLSSIEIASLSIASNATVESSGRVYVSNVLPDVDQLQFIKFVAQRWNCLIDFDDVTQTITFTKLDSIRKADAVDMTDKLSGYRIVPPSGYSERNYLRSTEAEELIAYRSGSLAFGDSSIESDGQGEQDIFKTIFRPAETGINANLDWLITSVPLVRLEDADTGKAFTSVSDSGGLAVFVGTAGDFDFSQDEVVRIESAVYNGFTSVGFTNTVNVTPYDVVYAGNSSGLIFKQKIVFPSAGSRELIICPSTPVSDINIGSPVYGAINVKVLDNSGTYPTASPAWAYFAKSTIGTNLDSHKVGLNYGSVQGTGNLTFGSQYHKILRKVVTGPRLEATMTLREHDYKGLDFSNFVFLRTADVSGYFLILEIGDYRNRSTPVEMKLVLIDGD